MPVKRRKTGRNPTNMPRRKEPHVGVVVVTHDQAAVAMVAAAFAIVGELPAVTAVCVGVGESFAKIVEKISRGCEEVDQGSGVLLMVDVHGKSIMGLLTLVAAYGMDIVIVAVGPDAATAVEALGTLVDGGFDEGVEPEGAAGAGGG